MEVRLGLTMSLSAVELLYSTLIQGELEGFSCFFLQIFYSTCRRRLTHAATSILYVSDNTLVCLTVCPERLVSFVLKLEE